MASQLTTVSVRARQGIRWGIYLVVFLIVGRFVLDFGIRLYNQVKPPTIVPPTLGFGDQLQPIVFPKQTSELPTLTYTVETADGFLPKFPEQLKVYAFEKKAANLFSYEDMVSKAGVFGFGSPPLKKSERIYQFTHSRVPSTLEADVITSSFSISYNLAADTSPLNSRSPSVAAATKVLTEKLKNSGLYPQDIKDGKVENIYLKAAGQNLTKALSLADAQLVQVSFFRQGIGDDNSRIPVVTPDPEKGNIWFFVSGSSDRDKQIVAGEYRYFPVDLTLSNTYPIKTAKQALDDLAKGKGYIANLGKNIDGKVAVDNIYLAYYDPNEPSDLMQPVVVIEGRDDFVAYVPAITDAHLVQAEQN